MFNPRQDGPIAQTPPVVVAPCKGCCCCVVSVTIENIRTADRTPRTYGGFTYFNGHAFDVLIIMRFDPGAECDECDLEWWERDGHGTRNADGTLGPVVWDHTWEDKYKTRMESETFRPWRLRASAPCPKGGGQIVKITDFPAVAIAQETAPRPVTGNRILEFRIIVRSGKRCSCQKAAVRVTARQLLVLENGLIVDSQFKTPNPDETSPDP